MFMTLEGQIYNVAQQSGLAVETVRNLLEAGWTFVQEEERPSMWVAPEAKLPVHIQHNEPWCDHVCMNMAPHRHGFSCFNGCKQCHAVCHPNCPAHVKEQ